MEDGRGDGGGDSWEMVRKMVGEMVEGEEFTWDLCTMYSCHDSYAAYVYLARISIFFILFLFHCLWLSEISCGKGRLCFLKRKYKCLLNRAAERLALLCLREKGR